MEEIFFGGVDSQSRFSNILGVELEKAEDGSKILSAEYLENSLLRASYLPALNALNPEMPPVF
jgi:hypothetical protein